MADDNLPADLRTIADGPDTYFTAGTLRRAADEIERLRAKVAEQETAIDDSLVKFVGLKAQHREQLVKLARGYIVYRPAKILPAGSTPVCWQTGIRGVGIRRHATETDALAAVLKGAGIEMEETT